MSDLLKSEAEYIRELAQRYQALGFEILSEAHDMRLGFRPDLVVRKGDSTMIVEVKSADEDPRAKPGVRRMREAAERLGYRFELKVLPRAPAMRLGPDDTEGVPALLERARRFLDDGHQDLALIQGWIALEISARTLWSKANPDAPVAVAPGDIVRIARDLDLIAEDELPVLRSIAELRNRLVHGFRTEIDGEIANRAILIAERAAAAAQLSSPMVQAPNA